MSYYPTSTKIWAYISEAWADLTPHVIGAITGISGMSDNAPMDLLADTGFMRFILNNTSGIYAPGLGGSLAGWDKGVPIKLEITYDEWGFIVFRGKVDSFIIQSGTFGGERVIVTVVDWLDDATKHPIISPGIQEDKRGDELLTTVVAGMPVQPQATDFDEGVNTFPTIFDIVRRKTKAYSEFAKIVFSEIGYIYLKRDRIFGETLIFESAEARHGLREPTMLPRAKVESGWLLKEDGEYLLLETGGNIVLNQRDTFVADNVMTSLEVEYGENVINRFTNFVYPRRVDDAPQVLFSLGYPMQIGSGETIEFRGHYTDLAGGAEISGFDMVAPVADTDYKMWTESDGTGDDLTADLTVTPVYGTEGVSYTLYNGSIKVGWITLLQARGYGIYTYNPIEHAVQDTISRDEFGYKSETLHQKYKQDLTRGSLTIAKWLNQEKRPRSQLNKIHLVGNSSGALMMAFLNLGVGDMVHVQEAKTGIDEYAYIQAVEFAVTPGGFVKYSWLLRGALSLLLGLSLISCEFDHADEDCISFGYLPQVSNLPERSFSAKVYIHSVTTADTHTIAGIFSDAAGVLLGVNDAEDVENSYNFVYYQKGTGAPGTWNTPADTLPLNQWVHIVATRDSSDPANVPNMYVDAVDQVLVEAAAQGGATADETGSPLFIGNVKTTAVDYTYDLDGLVKDLRIYNVILTQAEVTELEGGGNVTRGLVFQGPCVPTGDLADYEDKVLLSTDRLIDNMFGMVGAPHDTPTTRLIS